METLELKAPDISCGHCVNAIRKAVTRLGGVELVDADIPAGTVRLRYEPGRANRSEIERALAGAGYPVED
jgi:copper chaperone CopZ